MHRWIVVLIAPFVLALGLASLVAAQDGTPTPADCGVPDSSPEASPAVESTATETTAAAAEGTPTMPEGCVMVTLSEWKIDMPTEIPAGTTTFVLRNVGEFPHTIEIEGQGIEEVLEPPLQAGETKTLTVDLEAGTYEVYCPVGDGRHREQGMELELTVS